MNKKGNMTKTALMQAYDKSKSKAVADVCRIAGISRDTFYYHLNNDGNFKRQLLEKQREHLNGQIEAAAA